jgi:hypothetical protein
VTIRRRLVAFGVNQWARGGITRGEQEHKKRRIGAEVGLMADDKKDGPVTPASDEATSVTPARKGAAVKKRAGKKKKGGPARRKGGEPVRAHFQMSADQLPRKTLEEALRIPRALREVLSGGPAKWPEIAKATQLSLSQKNKYYLWAAQAYGLVEKAEDQFSISETARKILAPTKTNEDKEATVKAVLTPILLSRFFTDYNTFPFPAEEHIANVLETRYGVPRERTDEAKVLLKENGLYAGILAQQPDGSMVVRLDPSAGITTPPPLPGSSPDKVPSPSTSPATTPSSTAFDFPKMCFVITPIGDDDSEQRKHADLILKNVIEPLMEEFQLVAKRADQIDRAGIITQQVFECVAKARVCIADLSFSNANAFYELGIRHMCKVPTIQLIRKGDKIPFDVSQGRTIKIDMKDVYSVIDSIESGKRELREHLRHVLSADYKGEDNPVNVYLPGVEVRIPR